MGVLLEKKRVIKDRIDNVKRRRYLIDIYKIIKSNNDIDSTENKNGIFIHFENLSDATYKKLEKYLNAIDQESQNTETEFSATISETNSATIIEENYGTKLKFSNKEKNIIRKKEYENMLKSN
jgi:hypothetical protein